MDDDVHYKWKSFAEAQWRKCVLALQPRLFRGGGAVPHSGTNEWEDPLVVLGGSGWCRFLEVHLTALSVFQVSVLPQQERRRVGLRSSPQQTTSCPGPRWRRGGGPTQLGAGLSSGGRLRESWTVSNKRLGGRCFGLNRFSPPCFISRKSNDQL